VDSVDSGVVDSGVPTRPFDIPDFAKDSATIAEYAAAREQYERSAIADAESEVRSAYSRKKAGVLAEIAAASASLEERKKIAASALHAYQASYPMHVSRVQIDRPGFFEIIFSFGGALSLYNSAARSAEEVIDAQAILRRRQRWEEELEQWLARSLSRATSELKEKMQSAEWKEHLRAQPELSDLSQRVEAINAEREDYTRRLADGEVSAQEQRDRTMAENGIMRLRPPFETVMIENIRHYGDLSCWLFEDATQTRYWLPYDRRLSKLIDWVFDTYRLVDDLEAKFSRSAEGRRITPLDRFQERFSDQDEARSELRKRTSLLRSQQDVAREAPIDDSEDKEVLDLLADLAGASATTHAS
jgi:hypothetical protein